jgi:thiamine pyrophosphokinase
MPAEGRMSSVAFVFTGGDRPSPATVVGLPTPDVVVAADSGLHHAQALGYGVDVLVGDLDSVDSAALAAAIATGTEVQRHPTAKDATDLELALLTARDRDCDRVVVVGGNGGRFDHLVANTLLLASPEFAGVELEAHVGNAHLFVVRHERGFHGVPGDMCSLLPVGGPAVGVRTVGLRYPLRQETLYPGSTRGVSNEFVLDTATVALDDGTLLAVLPDAPETRS